MYRHVSGVVDSFLGSWLFSVVASVWLPGSAALLLTASSNMELPPAAVFAITFTVLLLGRAAAKRGALPHLWVSSSTAPLKLDSAPQTWLSDMADSDRSHLAERMVVVGETWNPSGLSNMEPYMDFEFSVFNGSVFPVSITGDPKGHIYWGDAPLSRIPEIEPTTPGGCAGSMEHGAVTRVRLRQYVMPETAAELRKRRTEPIAFQFHNLRVPVMAEDEGKTEERLINLGSEHLFNWP